MTAGKTVPELTAETPPIVGTDELVVYRSPGPLKRATASTVRTYMQSNLGTMVTQNANAVASTGGSIAGITDLAVADGGTGASTASAARDTLGLTIGTNVQAYDADLTAIAALTSAADKMPYATGAQTWALADLTSFARTLLATASNSAFLAALGQIASSAVDFLQAGTGAVTRTGQDKLRDILHVKDVGVIADGTTNDTAAYQAAITAAGAQGKDLDHGEGTILIHSEINGTALSGTRLFGKATIKAANSTDFQYLLDISSTTGVTIEGLTFDANKDNRGSATVVLSCVKANTTTLNRLLDVTCQNTLGLTGPVSSIAISASGGVLGLYARGLRFLNLGTDANTKPSDGIFARGTFINIVDTYGDAVTDHIAVLEGCSYSAIINTTGKNCTSFVAMSNDTNTDVTNNIIDGVHGTCNHFGSFGAIVGVYTFGTGWIRNCLITNITARGASGATGGGPAMLFDGKIEGTASNLNLHPGASTGVMNQAILIDIDAGGSGLIIRDSTLEVEGSANVIRIQGSSDGVRIEDNYLREGAYGIYADGTSSFTEFGNRFFSQSSGKIGLGGSASYWGSTWQGWTPVFSSDIGDAAATFTATPTVVSARISRVADTINVRLNFDATLKAVSPAYLACTVPSWALPLDNNQWTPANVLNDTTRETGEIRTIGGTGFRIYRANLAAFSANANVSCHVAFLYEAA